MSRRSATERVTQLEKRVDYLERVNRQTADALRLAASLSSFETSLSRLETPRAILEEICSRVARIVPCLAQGIFLFREGDGDLELSHCTPPEFAERFNVELADQVEHRSLAWALHHPEPYFVSAREPGQVLVMHSLATASRIRGVYLALVEAKAADLPDCLRLVLSIVMHSSANSLESFALYHLVRDANLRLAQQLERLAESERALQQAHDWLRAIFDVMPVGVHIVAEDYTVLEASDLLLDYYRVPDKKRVKGRCCFELLKGRGDPCPECAVQRVLRTGRAFSRFSSEEDRQRTGRSFKIFAAPVLRNGQTRAVAEFHLDITDLRDLEGALTEAKERAESASKAKSAFLASMSHEFRTPMNAVIGMAQLALVDCKDAGLREYLETILDASGHLLALINDILDFSRIEARKLELEDKPFNLAELVAGVVRTLEPQAVGKGLRLVADVDAAVPRTVRGDAQRLRQVLLNLLGNALKFSEQGEVRCSLRPAQDIQGEEQPGHSWWLLCVQDQGIGIPADLQGAVFDEFFQVDGTLGRRQGGTGLGLSITKMLVQLMGGRIWLESAPGVGSSFSVLLPLADAVGEDATPHDSEVLLQTLRKRKVGQGRLEILLAEDNLVNARVATLFLERMGHEVTLARDGDEALGCLRQQRFDLVLMDLEMPGVDGLEATRRIRGGELGPEVAAMPIMAMTAHAMESWREQCLAAGMNAFLTKPVNFAELSELLQSCKEPAPQEPQSGENAPVLDLDDALRRMGGDREILAEVLAAFLADLSQKRQQLQSALKERDWPALTKAAHSLKGSTGTIGAVRCNTLAERLEQAVLDGRRGEVESLHRRLLQELRRVEEDLSAFGVRQGAAEADLSAEPQG